jgi:hypothetical protein
VISIVPLTAKPNAAASRALCWNASTIAMHAAARPQLIAGT